jgi:peroxiredoxin
MDNRQPHSRPPHHQLAPCPQSTPPQAGDRHELHFAAPIGNRRCRLSIVDASLTDRLLYNTEHDRQDLQDALVPALPFESARGKHVDLGSLACGWLVIYCYPGAPQQLAPESHLEDIREHNAFARRLQELRRRGVIVVALSSQPLSEQVEAMLALELRHRLLLDPRLSLAESLGLPTEDMDGSHYYRRQTLIVREHRVEHIFCPVTDAAANPAQVQSWMLAHGW